MKLRFQPWWLISGVALAIAANAAEPPAPVPAQDSTDATTATAEYNGMKVAIDRKTGKLRPLTAAESQQLDAMLTQQRRANPQAGRSGVAAAPATEAAAIANARHLPKGGTAMKLPESQMEYVIATRDADGNLVLRHSSEGDVTEELPNE
ncbi:MAG TPA: hypothetical protein VIT22_08735 [Pseudoxanthomonas sp.]